jgi:hypothetical protein
MSDPGKEDEAAPEVPADSKHESDNNSNAVSTDDEENEAKRTGKKRPLADSEEEKKAERRAANRRSAFQSRQRRKILIEDLQRTVAGLSKENTDLRKSNEDLRVQLKTILLENHQFRMQQRIPGSQGGATGLMQASALLNGGGQQPILSQLLGGGGQVIGPSPSVGPGTGMGGDSNGANAEGDSLLSARLALATAQARVNELGQSQDSSSRHTLQQATSLGLNKHDARPSGLGVIADNPSFSVTGAPPSTQFPAGLQSLLESARPGLSAASLPVSGHFNALHGILENAALGGAASQLGGIPGLMESNSSLTDIQRAILSGGNSGNPGVSNLGQGMKPNNLNEGGITVSEALRNLLQKNQPSC